MTPKPEPVVAERAPTSDIEVRKLLPSEIAWLYRANPRKLADLTRSPDEAKRVRNATGE